ncbi:MAG: hypothetical protein HOW73_05545 [Polyangiaceae bacterium]|nr:hypothetical protein [Polyangiaceae bacterium]
MRGYGLLARFRAKSGKEAEVEELLRSALPMVRQEPSTRAWFAIHFRRGEYGIFDTFRDEAARTSHLEGPIGTTLQRRTAELFEAPIAIRKCLLLAQKLPLADPLSPDTRAVFLTFKPKQGHELEAEDFLRRAEGYVRKEERTTAWYALRFDDGEVGIFDVFPDGKGRMAHLVGRVPFELARHAVSLVGSVPNMQLPKLIAEKIAA